MTTLRRAALALVVLLAATGARADQLDWTMRLTLDHATASVADAEAKRNVGMMNVSGPATVAGEEAEATVLVLYDYANGTGPWQAYMTVTFADGSVLTTYASGLTVADDQGLNSRFEGPMVVIAGTGRFDGAHGAGSMKGQRAEAVGDHVQVDYTLSLRLD